MQILGISVEDVRDSSILNYGHGSKSHILIPAGFLLVALMALLGLEYYKDWKRKRRMNRLLDKAGRIPKLD